jgi:hypothetical protein
VRPKSPRIRDIETIDFELRTRVLAENGLNRLFEVSRPMLVNREPGTGGRKRRRVG